MDSSTVLGEYLYNGKGQRADKLIPSQNKCTVFHYDQNGLLITESTRTGNIKAEYVYLNGQPLAKIEGNNVYYYHDDHLGTPMVMTDASGSVAWSGEYLPFGESLSVTGSITNNLRFPGQYYDSETGLHQNWHRDYRPEIGRYVQSDPIGLKGGLNRYIYSKNNPLRYSDRMGLKAGDVCYNITIKRKHIDKTSDEDKYGHWWIEIGAESYGWWPKYPVDLWDTVTGVEGELNGQTYFGGTSTRDPKHGKSAEETFHPKISSSESCKSKTCEAAVGCIRNFAKSYSGNWSWPWGQNCHSFQTSAMSACGIEK